MKPLLFILLLLSATAHAQPPNYYTTPDQQIRSLQRSLSTARDSIRLVEGVLFDTRAQMVIAIGEREGRIKMLEDSCNSELGRQSDARTFAENQAYSYKESLLQLHVLLTKDLEHKRTFGWRYYWFMRNKLLPLTVVE